MARIPLVALLALLLPAAVHALCTHTYEDLVMNFTKPFDPKRAMGKWYLLVTSDKSSYNTCECSQSEFNVTEGGWVERFGCLKAGKWSNMTSPGKFSTNDEPGEMSETLLHFPVPYWWLGVQESETDPDGPYEFALVYSCFGLGLEKIMAVFSRTPRPAKSPAVEWDAYLRKKVPNMPPAAWQNNVQCTVAGSCEAFDEMAVRVGDIVAVEDPVVRNMQISQTYHDLSINLKAMMAGRANASITHWVSMAASSSAGVGIGIRGKMANLVTDEMISFLPSWIRKLMQLFPDLADLMMKHVVETSAEGLTAGNLEVFKSVATGWTSYGRHACRAKGPDPAVLKRIKASSPDILWSALEAFWDGHWAKDQTEQYQHFLRSDLLTGVAEQNLLIPYINDAMANWTFSVGGRNYTYDISSLETRAIVLPTGNEMLWPKKDVPLRWDGLPWPHQAKNLSQPVRDIYLKWVGQAKSLTNTSCPNWKRFEDRMRFIVTLFRSRLDDPYFNCPIYSLEQQHKLWHGKAPAWGDLCQGDCCTRNGFGDL